MEQIAEAVKKKQTYRLQFQAVAQAWSPATPAFAGLPSASHPQQGIILSEINAQYSVFLPILLVKPSI